MKIESGQRRKVALITGAAGTLGCAVAKRLSGIGYQIVAVDRDNEGLARLETDLGDALCCSIMADVGDESSTAHYVESTVKSAGRIDFFFNNAGIEGPVGNIVDYDIADFDRVMCINVRGIFLGLKHVIPVMLRQSGGSIINSASSAGCRGAAGLAAYAASKHAVIGLTRSAAAEYGPANIRINCVAPGPVAGRMIDSIAAALSEGAEDALAARIPIGRLAEPDDVAAMVAFLASDETRYITGGVFPVDGGRTAV